MSSTWVEKTVKLTHPIKDGDKTISEITLREPDVEALETLEDLIPTLGKDDGSARNKIRDVRLIASVLSGVSADALKKIHRDDFTLIAEVVTPLFIGEKLAAELAAAEAAKDLPSSK